MKNINGLTIDQPLGSDLGTADQGHLPDSDDVVGVSGEECLAVSGPSHGETLGSHGQGVAGHLGAKLLNLVLAFEVPDLDGWAGGGAEPVPVKNKSFKWENKPCLTNLCICQGFDTSCELVK